MGNTTQGFGSDPRGKSVSLAICVLGALVGLVARSAYADEAVLHLPYREAGLSERQAAAYLLDRLAFGGRPGEVDLVVSMGLDRWVEGQLQGGLPEPNLDARIEAFPAVRMTQQEITARYPGSQLVSAHARRFFDLIPPAGSPVDFDWVRRKLEKFRKEQGMMEDKLLYDELAGQKIVRAVYAENQLTEVLTDFWANHFHASHTSFRSRPWLLSYERDSIRPNVLGRFHDLLRATARHPAILQYLENAQSAPPTDENSLMAFHAERLRAGADAAAAAEGILAQAAKELEAVEAEEEFLLSSKFRKREGVKDTFARVLLDAHTLGPDGGQTAEDVAAVARAFSGWTSMPIGATAEWFKTDLASAQKLGFVRDGLFLFRADWHDAGEKQPFGLNMPPGGGVEEGEQVLDYLSAHPATARHVARKLAVRFVSENPPQALLDRLAGAFQAGEGDLRLAMRTLLESQEFWDAARERSRVKSPLELVASALRAGSAEVTGTKGLSELLARMGQPLYSYQGSYSGFPDRGEYWIQAGTLVHRMDFAINLGAGRIDGVAIDPSPLVPDRGTGTSGGLGDALALLATRVLPERDVAQTIDLLRPIVDDPRFLEEAPEGPTVEGGPAAAEDMAMAGASESAGPQSEPSAPRRPVDALARLFGMIVGSPEFQLR